MKIAICTDLHWGVRNNSQFFMEKQEEFFYNFFIPYLIKHNIDTIWMLGDFFENRKMLSTQILNRSYKFLQSLEDYKINSYFLMGNHDVHFKNTNAVNSLIPISKAFDRVYLIEKFEIINFDDLPVGFVSWISPEIYTEALEWIKNVNVSVLCGHFGINSFEIIKGLVCSGGIEQDIFERFDKVFSGHFHIRATNGVIHYIGNPYQTNWGESGDVKGFAVFDTKTKNVKFVNNPVSIYSVFQYNDDIKINLFDREQYSNKIVRIVVNECKDRKKLETIINEIGQVAHLSELFENKEIIVNDEKQNEVSSDTLQLIYQFLETCKIDHLDKKQLTDNILNIYSEALERSVLNADI